MTKHPFLPSQQGFLGLEPADNYHPQDAKVVVIPYGLEASVSYVGGTAQGPEAILTASHQVELFDEEFWCEPFRSYGIATLQNKVIADQLPMALDELEKIIDYVLQQERFPLILGGEHSITAGSIRPFSKRFSDLVVLHFDAHADLRDQYEGEVYSHAAAMRRVLDHDNIHLISIGVRNISAEEIPFLEQNPQRIAIHWAKDKSTWCYDEMLAPLTGRQFYLSFDLDVFDSSLMPATGTPEPGGLFFAETLDILRKAYQLGTCVGADLVELSPRDNLHACNFLAAKLGYKILNYKFMQNIQQ